jgi:hypothetical protein
MSMKKLLAVLALALIAQPALAAATFFWRAEGTTLTADDFSASDTTATANGGVSISNTAAKVGTNGILTTNQQDYYIFSPTSIFTINTGSFGVWMQYKTAIPASGNDTGVNAKNSAGNDKITMSFGASEEVRITLTSSGGTQTSLTTGACNFVIDTWYFILVRWDIPNDDRFVACYNSSGALISSNEDLTTDLAASAPTTIDELRIGNSSGHTSVVWTDNAFVSQSYSESFENFHSITSFVPVYSAGPTNGTFTNTTLPFTYTPDQNGTTYAAACTNGQTVTTFANLKSGTCSGGAALGTGTDISVATVSDTVTITGLVASTTYDVYIGHESTIGGQSTISSLADRTTTGASINFSVGPSQTPATNGFTIAGTITCTGTCTVEAVACAPGDAVPTANEIEAGQCGGGNAAMMNAQENWTTGVGNDFPLTSTNKPVRFDVYVSGTNGTTDTSVNSFTDQDRSIRSGFAMVAHTSCAATAICDLDSYFTPDVATGDVFEYEDDTNEDADCNISFEVDGDCVMTPVGAGDCDGLRTFEISYEDVSSATDALFTAPAVGNYTTDDTIYINNTAPVCSPETSDQVIVLTEDVAMSARDLTNVCTDADLHTLTFSIISGTIPVGTSLSGAGSWTGTPNTENEAGAALTIQACDPALDCDTYALNVYVVNTWTVPNGVASSISTFSSAVIAAAPWRALDIGILINSQQCSDTIAQGSIISQNPAASAEAGASAVIGVVLSTGGCSVPATEERIVYILPSTAGLIQWVDYVPVSAVPGCQAGRYEENGCWDVDVISSITGKIAWVDYIPVFEVVQSANRWRYENDGWIPVDSLAP